MKREEQFYQNVLSEFGNIHSVEQTAKNCETSLVTAQRILITEGLWSRNTENAIGRLWCEGKNVAQIADELCVTEKTVQA